MGNRATGSNPTPPSSSQGSRRKREGSRPAGGPFPSSSRSRSRRGCAPRSRSRRQAPAPIRRFGIRRVPKRLLRKRHQNSYSPDHLQIATETGRNPAPELAVALLLYRPKSIVRMPMFSEGFSFFCPKFAQSKEAKSLNMVAPSMRTGETSR